MNARDQAYPRFLEPGCAPFNLLGLARQTEEIVCRGDHREYTAFWCVRMYGGIAMGYACGCCLRCVFCRVSWSRDFPERYGEFHSPAEAFRRLSRTARKARVDQLRISGAEPTLGRDHLLGLLEQVEDSPFRLFILETNRILLGADREELVRRCSRDSEVSGCTQVRIGLGKRVGTMRRASPIGGGGKENEPPWLEWTAGEPGTEDPGPRSDHRDSGSQPNATSSIIMITKPSMAPPVAKSL